MMNKPFKVLAGFPLLAMLTMPPMHVSAQSFEQAQFGRFFTTPRTRSELNNARENYAFDRPPPTTETPAEPPRRPQNVELNGVILRSDGSGQVWINGAPQSERTGAVESVSIERTGPNQPMVAVTMPGGNQVKLRPGETFSLETGTVRDGFQQEGKKPKAAPESGEDERPQNEESAETAAIDDIEQFDESELADRDFRILLLEKRLEKLESGMNTPEQINANQSQQ